MPLFEEILGQSRRRMVALQPKMAVATADLQRHTSQLETATLDTPEAQDIARKLDIDMRKSAALKDRLLQAINERDDGLKSAGFAD